MKKLIPYLLLLSIVIIGSSLWSDHITNTIKTKTHQVLTQYQNGDIDRSDWQEHVNDNLRGHTLAELSISQNDVNAAHLASAKRNAVAQLEMIFDDGANAELSAYGFVLRNLEDYDLAPHDLSYPPEKLTAIAQHLVANIIAEPGSNTFAKKVAESAGTTLAELGYDDEAWAKIIRKGEAQNGIFAMEAAAMAVFGVHRNAGRNAEAPRKALEQHMKDYGLDWSDYGVYSDEQRYHFLRQEYILLLANTHYQPLYDAGDHSHLLINKFKNVLQAQAMFNIDFEDDIASLLVTGKQVALH